MLDAGCQFGFGGSTGNDCGPYCPADVYGCHPHTTGCAEHQHGLTLLQLGQVYNAMPRRAVVEFEPCCNRWVHT